ncbi:DUF3572 domain-containing protein [Stappia sp. TSB10P1A]|uniref:DUF3572 domain-containing protein n=1 Tax=Stappia sp. TSB10P1A TaxID=2003585 RepID=UPI001643CD6C|nr:DUF3572 domain-containing protein [Stappia sp. TSB10P1A]
MIARHSSRLGPEEAEAVAADALGYLAHDMEHLGRFLALAGIGPAELRQAASEPGFLIGVLEFYMGHEALLLAFCEARGLRPTTIATARHALDTAHGADGFGDGSGDSGA